MNTEINTMNPQFNTREEYLVWRTAWRADYKAQSQLIRDTKKALREAYRKEFGREDEASSLQSKLHYQRVRANALMNARMKGKERMMEQKALALAAAA